MSELRKRCEELADMIIDAIERYGASELLRKNAVVELEAFAKAEQIKGMEAVKAMLQAHPARVWLTAQIDAEIAKLKLAGTQIDARNDREILGDLPATKEGG